MNAVAKPSFHLPGTIKAPAEIRDIPGWLMWRFEHHEGESKPRKVPVYVSGQRRHGQQGSPEDRRQLTTFEAARAAAAWLLAGFKDSRPKRKTPSFAPRSTRRIS